MDQKLFLLINRVWTHPVLDRFMAGLTSFDVWVPFIVILVLLAAWRGGFRVRAFLVTAALTAALADGAIANPLKRLTDRPRPGDTEPGVRQVELAKVKPRVIALFL